MGMLLDLLTLPLTGPLKTVLWLAETIHDQAEGELYNPEKIRAQLAEMEMRLDLGEIDEETYMQAEEILLERLREARRRLAEQAAS